MRLVWIFLFMLTSQELTSKSIGEHEVKVGNFTKTYPIAPAPADPHTGIIFLYDVSDNWHLAMAVATELCQSIQAAPWFSDIEAVVIPGDGGNMMAGLLFHELKKKNPALEICIVRSNTKGEIVRSIEYQSITSPTKKKLNLRKDQYDRIQGKKVIIFDDVLSSGSTFRAVKQLLDESGCKVLGYACMATEGEDVTTFDGAELFKTTHLPTFKMDY